MLEALCRFVAAPQRPEGLAELRLLPVLEAIPAVGGKVASRRLMAAAGVPEDIELGAIPEAAWSVLLGERA